MYDDLTPHAAHDRVVALLQNRTEFTTAKGNAFTARVVGPDIELRANGNIHRVNFGEFSMFLRCAHRMTAPNMGEFQRFTPAAAALVAIMDAVVTAGPARPTVALRERVNTGQTVPHQRRP